MTGCETKTGGSPTGAPACTTFAFRCGPERACFGACCRDVTIVLTPYDVVRLKNALHMDSTDFLEQYTLRMRTAEQKFPLVLLKMQEEGKRCPLFAKQGCAVYDGRPWACRMYPLGTEPAEPGKPTHTILHEDFCLGHGQDAPMTADEWMRQQGAEPFEMMGAGFQELTRHSFWKSGKLTEQQAAMFYMACYDLDRFRRFVFETRFLKLLEVDEARTEALRTDDLELLDFGIQWLRFSIFGERTMKVRRNGA